MSPPLFPAESSLKDGLFHEYKKHGKVLGVKVFGQGSDRYAVVTFKKPEDAEKALQVSQDKQFFGCRIEVKLHEGLGKFSRGRLLSHTGAIIGGLFIFCLFSQKLMMPNATVLSPKWTSIIPNLRELSSSVI